MSPAPETSRHDPGGTIHLRPHGATAISLLTALLALALALDAVIRAGWQGVAALPLLLLVVVLVWMLLWAPRVVLHEEAIEVRNIFVTHHLPFAALIDVRIGAMLRLEAVTRGGRPATVTAWNAPALGRDRPWRREASMREQGLRGRRLTAPERRAHDESASRAAVVKQRWMRWVDAHEGESAGAAGPVPVREAEGGGQMHLVTRLNVVVVVALAVSVALVALRLAL